MTLWRNCRAELCQVIVISCHHTQTKPNTFHRIKVLSCLFETNLHPITIMAPRNIRNSGQFVILSQCENRWILKNPSVSPVEHMNYILSIVNFALARLVLNWKTLNLLTLVFFQSCMLLFFLWNTKGWMNEELLCCICHTRTLYCSDQKLSSLK